MPLSEAIQAELQQSLKNHLRRALQKYATDGENCISSGDNQKPFHEAILGNVLTRISRFERSFSTTLGTTFERCALIIAKAYHQEAKREHAITAQVPERAVSQIANLIREKSQGGTKTLSEMVDEVLEGLGEALSDPLQQISATSDLYIVTRAGEEIFVELKSPKPNKDQCEQAIRRILYIHLIRGEKRPQVQAYFALPYNPYGNRDYAWGIARRYLPDEALLVGEEFWNLVGGAGTYEQLLEIYREVGKEMEAEIRQAIGLDSPAGSQEE